MLESRKITSARRRDSRVRSRQASLRWDPLGTGGEQPHGRPGAFEHDRLSVRAAEPLAGSDAPIRRRSTCVDARSVEYPAAQRRRREPEGAYSYDESRRLRTMSQGVQRIRQGADYRASVGARLLSASTPPLTVSSETEKEKRRCPSPSGPKTTPGTVAMRTVLRSCCAAAAELDPSTDETFGKRYSA